MATEKKVSVMVKIENGRGSCGFNSKVSKWGNIEIERTTGSGTTGCPLATKA
jgi:hypothetical protein